MSGWLNGRVAVVTGASRGIGRATADALAAAGARVAIGARTGDALGAVAEGIRKRGGEAVSVPCDVSRAEDVEKLFARAESLGDPTVLVCAAGVLLRGSVEDTSGETFRRVIDVNLTGAYLCAHRIFPAMRKAGGGRIVNISSLGGMYGTEKFPGMSAYVASKHGLVGLTEVLAVEGRPHGIAAFTVSPGAVDTDMLRESATGLGAGLGPADVARFLVALLDGGLAPASGANIPLFSNRT